MTFAGRAAELRALEGCERPGLVLVEGRAGVGKTALIEHWLAGAPVLRAVGEGVIDQLVRRGGPADLISDVAVFVDDAQWADEASIAALAYAARRTNGRLVIAARPGADLSELARIAVLRLWLEPLPHDVLAALTGLTDAAARRVWVHAGGDLRLALALVAEFPASTWGDFEHRLPAPRELAAGVARRLEACAEPTRRLVEGAAVLRGGCPLADAATVGGVDASLAALEEAITAGLLEESRRRALVFAPPAVGAAVYGRLGPVRRAELHRAAAAIAEDETMSLLHLAAAAPGPDGALAERLAAQARQTRERPEAARALVAASRLSPTRAQREDRLVRAVDWMLLAGDAAQARGHAAEVAACAPTARRDSVLGQLAVAGDRVREAGDWLRSAWERCEDDDELAATIAHRNAFHALIHLRDPEVADWARRALELAPDDPLAVEWQATLALSLWRQGRRAEAHALLRDARSGDAERDAPLTGMDAWLRIVGDDIEDACEPLADAARIELRLGAQEIGVVHLNVLSRAHFEVGAWEAAVAVADQAVAHASPLEDVSARMWAWWAALLVPAARGDEQTVRDFARRAAVEPTDAPDRVVAVAIAQAVAATDPRTICNALQPVTEIEPSAAVDEPGFWPWQHLYGDALVATGRLDEAAAFLPPHEALAGARGHTTAQARLALVRGRLETARGDAERAEQAFTEAVERLEPLQRPYDLALARLALGRFLRRERRRRSGAELLTAAGDVFESLGARPALERARRELEASGLKPARRDGDVRLTPQELTVARLVAGGRSNRAVADDLQLSVKTVEVHLTRIYAKLGIHSRGQLARQLTDA